MNNKGKEVQKATRFWFDCAKDNFYAAEAMFKTGRWSLCMFMCQQTLEALFKGVYILKKKDRPPYIHILPKLVDCIGLRLPQKIDQYIILVDAHYIKARYKEIRFNPKVYNKENAKRTLRMTNEVLVWFTKKMNLKL